MSREEYVIGLEVNIVSEDTFFTIKSLTNKHIGIKELSLKTGVERSSLVDLIFSCGGRVNLMGRIGFHSIENCKDFLQDLREVVC